MIKQKYDVFSVQVICISDNLTSLLIHRISDKKDKKENMTKSYNLQIGWIIIGYSNNFIDSRNKFKIDIIFSNAVITASNLIDICDRFQK